MATTTNNNSKTTMTHKLTKQDREQEFLNSLDNSNTQEELFDEIVSYIRKNYANIISEADSRMAAWNLVNFYEILYESLREQIRRQKKMDALKDKLTVKKVINNAINDNDNTTNKKY